MTTTEATVRSADGTTIALERSGAGQALILVDAAGGYREVGPLRSLAKLLAADFTVFTYDRRGREEWETRLAFDNSQPGAAVVPEAPVPRWGWGEAPPFEG
jgi:hypothetical protein